MLSLKQPTSCVALTLILAKKKLLKDLNKRLYVESYHFVVFSTDQ